MRSSDLRHRITIQKKTSGRDENGYDIGETWADHIKLWAKVSPLSAKDLLAAQAAQAQTVARMKIRYRTDITTEMRVIHRGYIYAIDSPPLADNQSGLEYVTFLLSEGVEKFGGD